MGMISTASRNYLAAASLALIAGGMANNASATSRVDFALSLQVPASCTITSLVPNAAPNSLDVTASCNAEYFSVRLGGGLDGARILQVNSASALAHANASGFSAHASRPGTHNFTLTFEDPIAPDDAISAQIELL